MNPAMKTVLPWAVLAAGMAFATFMAMLPLPAASAPFVPGSGADVLETLPRRSNASDAGLTRQRARLAAAPRDPEAAAELARR